MFAKRFFKFLFAIHVGILRKLGKTMTLMTIILGPNWTTEADRLPNNYVRQDPNQVGIFRRPKIWMYTVNIAQNKLIEKI